FGTTAPKYIFEASRDYPFSPWKLTGAAIYLKESPHSASDREAARRYFASWRGRIIGILAGGPGGAADDVGASLICANTEDGPADRILVELADTNGYRSGKLAGKAYVPGGGSAVDVAVQTRDRLLWPLLVAVAGV